MKKHLGRYLLLALFGCACQVLTAREVTVAEATQAATAWASRNAVFAGDALQVQTPLAVTNEVGTVLYYKVMLGARGMVIVAGDTNLTPIIAAVPDATSPELPEGHPLAALLWSDMTARRALLVSSGVQSKARTASVDLTDTIEANNSRWDDLLGTNTGIQTFALNSVGAPARVYSYPKPWSTRQMTHWSQTSENEYVSLPANTLYNFNLPFFTNGNQVQNAGCVAIAGAAILEFFQVPEGPVKVQKTIMVNDSPRPETYTIGGVYNWACLPTWKKNVELSSDAKNLLGTVPYDLGVLVEMNYKNTGSAAGEHKLADVLTTHYKFYNATSVYTDASKFASHIYPQVRAGAPVFLSINDGGAGGHAVVAVGYGEDDGNNPYTRVFMGWGGAGDAWYALPNIRGGDFLEGAGNYNTISSVITNISLDRNAVALCGRVTNTEGLGVPSETVTIRYQALNESAQEERVVTTGLYGEYAVRVPPATRYTLVVGDETKAVNTTDFCPPAINFEIEKAGFHVYTEVQEALDAATQEGKILFVLSGPAWDESCVAIQRALVALGAEFTDDFIFYYNDTDYGLSSMNVGTPGYATFDPRTFVLSAGANGNVALVQDADSSADVIRRVLATSLEKQGSSGIARLEIVGETATVEGGAYMLQVTYTDGLSQTLPEVTWAITSGGDIAVITSEGVLSFTETDAASSITIEASTILHGEPKTATLTVRKVAVPEINAIAITGIEGNTINLEETPNPVFTCTATLTDGTTCRVKPSWGVTDAAQLYYINASGGLFYGKDTPKKASHTVTLTATYAEKSATLDCTIYGYAGVYVSKWDFSPKENFPGTIVRVVITELKYTYAGQTITTTDTSLAEYQLIESSTGKASYFSTDEIEIAIPKGATSGGKEFVLNARKKDGQNTDYPQGTSNIFGVRPLEPKASAEKGSVPHGWLSQQFPTEGITDYEAKADEDSDGDGYANWQEYVLGTDPTDEASTLRLNLVVPSAGELPEVTWNERPGRTYELLAAEALDGAWGDLSTTSRFFKVHVTQQ